MPLCLLLTQDSYREQSAQAEVLGTYGRIYLLEKERDLDHKHPGNMLIRTSIYTPYMCPLFIYAE